MTAPNLMFSRAAAAMADPAAIAAAGGRAAWLLAPKTLAQAAADGCDYRHLMEACVRPQYRAGPFWLADEPEFAWDIFRRLRLFMADCAARTLPIFEAAQPGDDHPRRAIEFARREAVRNPLVRTAEAFAVAAAATESVANAGSTPAAVAADAAACAAAPPAWGTSAYLACCCQPDRAAAAAEREWQEARLIARMSESEPEDWPV